MTRRLTLVSAVFLPGLRSICSDRALDFQGISGFVYNDLNANGRRDAGEPGRANVVVKAKDSSGALRSSTSDTTGYYTFSGLVPGTFTILVATPPLDAVATDDPDGVNTPNTAQVTPPSMSTNFGYAGQ